MRHPDGAIRLAASALYTFVADVSAHAERQPCAAARRGAREHAVLPIPRPDPDEGWW